MAIYIPSGGISTKDATAIPADVASGKIFYNAEGRQVGSGKMVKKILFPQITTGGPNSSGSIEGYVYSSRDGYTFSLYDPDSYAYWKDYYTKIDGVGHIIGIEIDGNYSFCPSVSKGYTIYTIRNERNTLDEWFYHYNGSVYLIRNPYGDKLSAYRNRQIIIYYTDKQ